MKTRTGFVEQWMQPLGTAEAELQRYRPVITHHQRGRTMHLLDPVGASLSPFMQQGNVIARKAHVGLNMGMMTLFLWQAVSGMEIVNKIWSSR